MKRVDGSLESLLQGVSQQAPQVRSEGQCNLQENMSSDPVLGLCRRQPTTALHTLFQSATREWKFRFVAIDATNQYVLAYKVGDVRLFNVETGVEETITIADGALAYLDGYRMSFVTIDKKTFMCSANKTVQMLADTIGTLNHGKALVQVMGASFSRDLKLTLTWKDTSVVPIVDKTVTITYNTGEGATYTDNTKLRTTYLAGKIKDACLANATFADYFTAEVADDCIYMARKVDNKVQDLGIISSDDSGNTDLTAVASTGISVSRLPRLAVDGYIIRMQGQNVDREDDYYLRFTQAVTGFGKDGVWKECANPEEVYKFDLTTMPHVLEYTDTGFTFGPGEWVQREIGDDVTNPQPTFVGRSIEDMCVFQGRLVFLAGSAVIMSRSNKPLNFWKSSAVTYTDDDVIDMESSVKYGVTMRRCTLHNRDLVIFADRTQFIVFGRTALTPSNASLVVTVSFDADLNADPVESGSTVFFAVKYGAFAGVREFYTESASDANNSSSITSHITEYITGRAKQLANSSNFDLLMTLTSASDTEAYVYQYVTMEQKRVQAAWSKWIFRNPMEYIFFVDNLLYMVQYNATLGQYELHSMSLDRSTETGVGYQIYLDAKCQHSDVHTSVTAPEADKRVYVQGAGCPNPGMLAVPESCTATVAVFSRDMQGGTVHSGFKYTSKFSPTRPYVRDGDKMPITTADLKLSKWNVTFNDSGAFTAVVTNRYKEDTRQDFSARIMGDINNIIGNEPIYSDNLIVPVRENAEYCDLILECEEHTPLFITQMDWTGTYIKRGSRLKLGNRLN